MRMVVESYIEAREHLPERDAERVHVGRLVVRAVLGVSFEDLGGHVDGLLSRPMLVSVLRTLQ